MSEKEKKKHLFKPGQSGNPEGRPKGGKNKSTLIKAAIEGDMVERLEKDAVKILEKTIHMALGGDTTCIKILMDRLLPARKAQEELGPKLGSGGINITINSLSKEEGTIINGEVVKEE